MQISRRQILRFQVRRESLEGPSDTRASDTNLWDEQRRRKSDEGGRRENGWSAYNALSVARRRTLAYFLVIHSIACLDNAPAGRQRYFMVSHLLACPGLFPFSTDIPAFAFTLRSTAHVRANVTSASAIGDAIHRFYGCFLNQTWAWDTR